ncbi:transcription initiation factor TFIIH subunit 4 [Strigomonas culicis]|uniref:General transcription factor IIH subunit 4 n=1 Tax=Strigomonas culicis TaxID=28005 RepID=S9U7V0_9TRYP|nr:transcription initiation factor TFIIH subunit 4 [Strigomonas culicis]|eukprot:EPY26827.1 transcription initiation factor TFIIH subunit 4 [Strigomonas culicis]
MSSAAAASPAPATVASSQTGGSCRAPDLSVFAQQVLTCPQRAALVRDCPALLLYVYQYVVACLTAGRRPCDPLQGTYREDSLCALLGVADTEALYQHIFAATDEPARPPAARGQEAATAEELWGTLRRALELLWQPSAYLEDGTAGPPPDLRFLYEVNGKVRFHFPDTTVYGRGIPLTATSLQNALEESGRQLRCVLSCALAGSAEGLRGAAALCQMVQASRLTPPLRAGSRPDGAEADLVTPEGIHFCMLSPQRQWWVLLSAALDRVVDVAQAAAVSRPLLWQLLAVLALLDTTQYVFHFPSRGEDAAANQLISRLTEVGLVYLIKREDRKCVVLSPHLRHALDWHSTAPLCAASLIAAPGSGAADGPVRMRREDTDTIITETNFRLYAYSANEGLLQIVGQFAEREEAVAQSALVAFRVTRDSFARALRKGISAAQVLTFLSLKAHPSMRQRYGAEPHAGARWAAADGPGAPTELAVPQSFCDQLLTWEREFSRVVFQKHLVLLRNLSGEQQAFVADYLTHMGEAAAVVHAEAGMLVVQAACYQRLLAPYIAAG